MFLTTAWDGTYLPLHVSKDQQRSLSFWFSYLINETFTYKNPLYLQWAFNFSSEHTQALVLFFPV